VSGTSSALRPPADAVAPVRHPDAPAPGELLGAHHDRRVGCGVLAGALDENLGSPNPPLCTIAVSDRVETDFVRSVPVGTVLSLEAEATAVAGRKVHSSATGRVGGPDRSAAVRADALVSKVKSEVKSEVKIDHFIDFVDFIDNGRQEDIRAAMDNPDRLRRARAFEVNP